MEGCLMEVVAAIEKEQGIEKKILCGIERNNFNNQQIKIFQFYSFSLFFFSYLTMK